MPTIKELSERKIQTHDKLMRLGMTPNPSNADDRLRHEIRYRLASKEWGATLDEFNAAVDKLTPAEVDALLAKDGD